MTEQHETPITVIEMHNGKVTAIHKGETDSNYMPVIVVQMDTHPNSILAPLCICFIELDGTRFYMQATDNGQYNLVRDIRLASVYQTQGKAWFDLPTDSKRRAAQYFDGSTLAEVMPTPNTDPVAMFDLLPTANPSITMKPGHPDWYQLTLGKFKIDIFMPDDNTALCYLFDGHLPQFILTKLAADDTGSQSVDMWLPTIGITGQDHVSFNSSGDDFIGCDLRKVAIDDSYANAVVIRSRK